MDSIVRVFIEIERHSNQKYEWNKETQVLELDRVLPYPYFYPYAYGFIPGTVATDGDAVDVIVLTEKQIDNNQTISIAMIGVLCMEDEQGQDDKLLCVLEEDKSLITDLSDIPSQCLYDMHWFFANYKSGRKEKWSVVHGYKGREEAIKIYKKSMIKK